jgi:hypothetical protein
MNFSLQQIEAAVDEDSWIQGEHLQEQDRVNQISELEKGLWIAEVEGYEVEVRLNGSKVLEGTCECKRFMDIGICGHIVATLIQLRRRQQAARQKQQAKARKPKQSSRLTTRTVLDHVELDELIDFVRDYARTNRNFAIALKARFASAVEAMDSQDKYTQLLDTTIKAVRKNDREITLRGSQRLLKVLGELDQQMQEARAEADYRTYSVIARTVIEKITPLLRKTSGKRAELRQFVEQTFEGLLALPQQQPAPTLLWQLWEYSLEEHRKLTYRSQQLDLNFFKLMLELAQEPTQLKTLLEAIDAHIAVYESEHRPMAPLLLQKVAALEQSGKQATAQKLMEQNLAQPDVLEYAIRQAQKRQETHRVKALAQTGLRLNPPEGTRNRLLQLLLDLALDEGESEAIQHYALLRFYETLQLDYYRMAKRATAKSDWPAQLQDILQKLGNIPYSTSLRDAKARLLAAEEAWPLLMDYAEDVKSLDLLGIVDEALLARFPERIKALYAELILEYAQHHLGRQTARRIRSAIERLIAIGAKSLAYELLEGFRTNYGERHTLMEELQGLGE